MVTAYALFALAEVGLEIENPWGEGPNDLDLDRYCLLLALDLGDVVGFGKGVQWGIAEMNGGGVGGEYGTFRDDATHGN